MNLQQAGDVQVQHQHHRSSSSPFRSHSRHSSSSSRLHLTADTQSPFSSPKRDHQFPHLPPSEARNVHTAAAPVPYAVESASATPPRALRHRSSLSVSGQLREPGHFRVTSTSSASLAGAGERIMAHQGVLETLPSDAPSGKVRAFYQRNKGLAMVLLAQVFGTLMNVTTRLLEIEGNHGKGMHPFQILFVRMIITTTLSTFYMWYTEIPYFPFGMPEVRWLLVLRGVGGFFGVFGMYYSLLYLPLADATVVTFLAPSISCFACAMLINEPFTRMEQVGTLISFVGVTLIARPSAIFEHDKTKPVGPATGKLGKIAHKHQGVGAHPADAVHDANVPRATHMAADVDPAKRMVAVLVALVGVFGSAMAFTTMRWIGKRAHPLMSVNYFCVMCTLVSGIAMLILPGVPFLLPQDAKEWTYLIFLGLCGFAMQFLLSAGLQHEKSSRATNMVYTQMLFALLFDKLVFGTNPSLLSLAGSGMILTSAIYVAIHKEAAKNKAEEEKRREEEARANGRAMEMTQRRSNQLRDEERGLVANMAAAPVAEDEEESAHLNGGANGKAS